MTIIGIAAAIASGLGPIRSASGQDSGAIVIDADECVDMASADARLACYDRRADAARQARERAAAPNDAVSSSANAELAPPASASSHRADARSDEDDARSEDGDDRSEDGDDRGEIVGTIAGVRETVPDAYLITLENGQVWRQVQPKRYPLRPGDEVRIYESRWGSYRLESDGPGTFIQVERVR